MNKFSLEAIAQAEAAAIARSSEPATATQQYRTKIDVAPLLRAYGDSLPELRARAEEIHRWEHATDDEIKRCSFPLLAPSALAKLTTILGQDMPSNDHLSVYVRWSTSLERDPVDAEMRRAYRRRVLEKTHAIGAELCRKVAADLQADLDALTAAVAPFHERYGFATGGNLVTALRDAIARLLAEANAPIDYNTGVDVRNVMNQWFTNQIPEISSPPVMELNRLNAAAAGATESTESASGTEFLSQATAT